MAGSMWTAVFGNSSNAANSFLGPLFGSGTGTMLASGYLYRKSFTGSSPATISSAVVIDVYTLPANSLDGTGSGFRSINVTVGGNVTGSANCTATINLNATTANIGSAVGGGTTIASTGTMNTAAQGWGLSSDIFYSSSGVVVYQTTGIIVATSHLGVAQAATAAVTMTGSIPICVTINAASSTANCSLWWWAVQGFN